jgi:hypothetical protein
MLFQVQGLFILYWDGTVNMLQNAPGYWPWGGGELARTRTVAADPVISTRDWEERQQKPLTGGAGQDTNSGGAKLQYYVFKCEVAAMCRIR